MKDSLGYIQHCLEKKKGKKIRSWRDRSVLKSTSCSYTGLHDVCQPCLPTKWSCLPLSSTMSIPIRMGQAPELYEVPGQLPTGPFYSEIKNRPLRSIRVVDGRVLWWEILFPIYVAVSLNDLLPFLRRTP